MGTVHVLQDLGLWPVGGKQKPSGSVLTADGYLSAMNAIVDGVEEWSGDGGEASNFSFAVRVLLQTRYDAPLPLWWTLTAVEKASSLDRKSADPLAFGAAILNFSSGSLATLKALSIVNASGRTAISAIAPVVALCFDVAFVLSNSLASLDLETVEASKGKPWKKLERKLKEFVREIISYTFLCRCRDLKAFERCSSLPPAPGLASKDFSVLLHPAFPLASKSMKKSLKVSLSNAAVVAEIVCVQLVLLQLVLEIIDRRRRLKKKSDLIVGQAEFVQTMKQLAIQSIWPSTIEMLLGMLLEKRLPVLELLDEREEILLRGVLFETVLLDPPLFGILDEGGGNLTSSDATLDHESAVFMMKLAAARQAVSFFRTQGDRSKSSILLQRTTTWQIPPQLMNWLKSLKKKQRLPSQALQDQKALIHWLVNTADKPAFDAILNKSSAVLSTHSTPMLVDRGVELPDITNGNPILGGNEEPTFIVDTVGEKGTGTDVELAADLDFTTAAKSIGDGVKNRKRNKKGSQLLFDRVKQVASSSKRCRLEFDDEELNDNSEESDVDFSKSVQNCAKTLESGGEDAVSLDEENEMDHDKNDASSSKHTNSNVINNEKTDLTKGMTSSILEDQSLVGIQSHSEENAIHDGLGGLSKDVVLPRPRKRRKVKKILNDVVMEEKLVFPPVPVSAKKKDCPHGADKLSLEGAKVGAKDVMVSITQPEQETVTGSGQLPVVPEPGIQGVSAKKNKKARRRAAKRALLKKAMVEGKDALPSMTQSEQETDLRLVELKKGLDVLDVPVELDTEVQGVSVSVKNKKAGRRAAKKRLREKAMAERKDVLSSITQQDQETDLGSVELKGLGASNLPVVQEPEVQQVSVSAKKKGKARSRAVETMSLEEAMVECKDELPQPEQELFVNSVELQKGFDAPYLPVVPESKVEGVSFSAKNKESRRQAAQTRSLKEAMVEVKGVPFSQAEEKAAIESVQLKKGLYAPNLYVVDSELEPEVQGVSVSAKKKKKAHRQEADRQALGKAMVGDTDVLLSITREQETGLGSVQLKGLDTPSLPVVLSVPEPEVKGVPGSAKKKKAHLQEADQQSLVKVTAEDEDVVILTTQPVQDTDLGSDQQASDAPDVPAVHVHSKWEPEVQEVPVSTKKKKAAHLQQVDQQPVGEARVSGKDLILLITQPEHETFNGSVQVEKGLDVRNLPVGLALPEPEVQGVPVSEKEEKVALPQETDQPFLEEAVMEVEDVRLPGNPPEHENVLGSVPNSPIVLSLLEPVLQGALASPQDKAELHREAHGPSLPETMVGSKDVLLSNSQPDKKTGSVTESEGLSASELPVSFCEVVQEVEGVSASAEKSNGPPEVGLQPQAEDVVERTDVRLFTMKPQVMTATGSADLKEGLDVQKSPNSLLDLTPIVHGVSSSAKNQECLTEEAYVHSLQKVVVGSKDVMVLTTEPEETVKALSQHGRDRLDDLNFPLVSQLEPVVSESTNEVTAGRHYVDVQRVEECTDEPLLMCVSQDMIIAIDKAVPQEEIGTENVLSVKKKKLMGMKSSVDDVQEVSHGAGGREPDTLSNAVDKGFIVVSDSKGKKKRGKKSDQSKISSSPDEVVSPAGRTPVLKKIAGDISNEGSKAGGMDVPDLDSNVSKSTQEIYNLPHRDHGLQETSRGKLSELLIAVSSSQTEVTKHSKQLFKESKADIDSRCNLKGRQVSEVVDTVVDNQGKESNGTVKESATGKCEEAVTPTLSSQPPRFAEDQTMIMAESGNAIVGDHGTPVMSAQNQSLHFRNTKSGKKKKLKRTLYPGDEVDADPIFDSIKDESVLASRKRAGADLTDALQAVETLEVDSQMEHLEAETPRKSFRLRDKGQDDGNRDMTTTPSKVMVAVGARSSKKRRAKDVAVDNLCKGEMEPISKLSPVVCYDSVQETCVKRKTQVGSATNVRNLQSKSPPRSPNMDAELRMDTPTKELPIETTVEQTVISAEGDVRSMLDENVTILQSHKKRGLPNTSNTLKKRSKQQTILHFCGERKEKLTVKEEVPTSLEPTVSVQRVEDRTDCDENRAKAVVQQDPVSLEKTIRKKKVKDEVQSVGSEVTDERLSPRRTRSGRALGAAILTPSSRQTKARRKYIQQPLEEED